MNKGEVIYGSQLLKGDQEEAEVKGQDWRYIDSTANIYSWNNHSLVVNWDGYVACGAAHIIVLLSPPLEAFLCGSLGVSYLVFVNCTFICFL